MHYAYLVTANSPDGLRHHARVAETLRDALLYFNAGWTGQSYRMSHGFWKSVGLWDGPTFAVQADPFDLRRARLHRKA